MTLCGGLGGNHQVSIYLSIESPSHFSRGRSHFKVFTRVVPPFLYCYAWELQPSKREEDSGLLRMRSDTLRRVVTNVSLHGVYCETFDVALRIDVYIQNQIQIQ